MSRTRAILVATALLATIASSLGGYPHHLAYFNEASGGPENGHRHLLGSNLDWRQDLLLVSEWVHSRGVKEGDIKVSSYGMAPWQDVFAFSDDANVTAPWEIVSANRLFQDSSNPEWQSNVRSGRSQRIGCTFWVFPGMSSADGK